MSQTVRRIWHRCPFGPTICTIVSTDYEEVYAAMKAAYENALDGVEQEDSDREYSFLEGWSATAVVHGDWMEWQIAELELQIPNGQPASQA